MRPEQEMHSAVEEVDLDPCDLYIDLGTLIVEGRVPGLTERGFGEGPHCPPPQGQNRHQCDPVCLECQRYEQIQKHMLLLWKNGIPMSIEVLMYPNCCAASTNSHNVDTASVSEISYILLEQWTVHMLPRRVSNAAINPRGLMQAVRSHLYFSQLCAWFSSTCGKSPQNVHYRLCVPGEAFSSKFSIQPETHAFPVSNIGRNTSMKVTVKTHPRFEKIPMVPCPKHHPPIELSKNPKHMNSLKTEHLETLPEELITCEDGAVGEYVCDGLVPTAVPLLPVSRTSSPADIMLGESLLDPPNSLCMYPKRYQSPSRCGSPSLEVPEHLMFGKGATAKRDAEMQRLNRDTRNRSRPQRRPVVERFLKKALGDSITSDSNSKSVCNPVEKTPNKYNEMLHFPSEDATLTHNGLVNYLCIKDDLKTLPQAEMECVLNRLRNQCQRNKTNSEEMLDAYLLNSPKSYSLLQSQNLSVPKCKPYISKVNIKKLSPEERPNECPFLEFQKPLHSPLVCDSFAYANNQPLCEKILNSQNTERPGAVEKMEKFRTKDFDKSSLSCNSDLSPFLKSTAKQRTKHINFKKLQNTAISSEVSNDDRKCPDENVHIKGSINRMTVVQNDVADKAHWSDVNHGKTAYQCKEMGNPKTSSQCPSSDFIIKRCLEADRTFSSELHTRPFVKLRTNPDTSLLYSLLNAVNIHTTVEDGNNLCHLVPSAEEKAQFRRSLDSATSLVFHQKNGLPLTSSPAPIRKSGTCFDFDSSLTTVSAIKRALFEKEPEDEEPELDDSSQLSISAPASITVSSLLGTFEESVLNGRLEPVSTVEGFTAEIGASGSFCPRHITLPVTVFFYTLQDTDKVTSPYLGHINLGKKEYYVPKTGTIQVTLFNPHHTVVKMYVVRYDLSDMPSNCQTFLRQRTLYMPTDASENETDARKWLRYLIHLRFASSKSGRIYLHTDIRVIIFRKSDLDAATVLGQRPYELRSFTHGPTNPKFSPRKL